MVRISLIVPFIIVTLLAFDAICFEHFICDQILKLIAILPLFRSSTVDSCNNVADIIIKQRLDRLTSNWIILEAEHFPSIRVKISAHSYLSSLTIKLIVNLLNKLAILRQSRFERSVLFLLIRSSGCGHRLHGLFKHVSYRRGCIILTNLCQCLFRIDRVTESLD